MPRAARARSETGIYHVMLRSINKQQIFYDNEDYLKFIRLLDQCRQMCGFKLYAYCLMGNHVHLLIGEGREPLKSIFRRLGTSFVYWYNQKYDRVGHLFQDRYKSEPVENESYFLTVLRYILQNPVAAGLSKTVENYPYGSGPDYLLSRKGITDTHIVFKSIDENCLKEFLIEQNDDKCMDLETSTIVRCNDTQAKKLILNEFGTDLPNYLKANDRRQLNYSIRRLIHAGLSVRQLSRLSGIPKKVIENGMKE